MAIETATARAALHAMTQKFCTCCGSSLLSAGRSETRPRTRCVGCEDAPDAHWFCKYCGGSLGHGGSLGACKGCETARADLKAEMKVERGQQLAPRECRGCRVIFMPTGCRRAFHSDNCRVAFFRMLDPRTIERRTAAPIVLTCKTCGGRFSKVSNKRLFCSIRCGKRFRWNKRNKRGLRGSGRIRAVNAGVHVDVVDRLAVFERDRWICQICGRKTPERLSGSIKPNAPELDHRVPIALGGAHSYENTQCACRACNARKGGHTIAGQLPLFAQLGV